MTATESSSAPSSHPTLSSAEIDAERQLRKRHVALGYRIFASLRWGDLGDGHITARDPEHTDCMWLLRYGVGFERATVDDLVLVRSDGSTLDGRPINMTAYNIHHPLHQARGDVVAVAHTHTQWGTPFCATGRQLQPITQEACHFFERWASFDDEQVQVDTIDGGHRIAAALGDHQAVLLRNHGLLTVGSSVADAVAAFVILERVTEAHLKAPDAQPISAEAARRARADLLAGDGMASSFTYLVQRHVGDPSVVG